MDFDGRVVEANPTFQPRELPTADGEKHYRHVRQIKAMGFEPLFHFITGGQAAGGELFLA